MPDNDRSEIPVPPIENEAQLSQAVRACAVAFLQRHPDRVRPCMAALGAVLGEVEAVARTAALFEDSAVAARIRDKREREADRAIREAHAPRTPVFW